MVGPEWIWVVVVVVVLGAVVVALLRVAQRH
jgi:bacteriorhodopsin